MTILGPAFALAFYSYLTGWTYHALTYNRPAVWQDIPRSFFWPVTLLAALITHPTNIDQIGESDDRNN